ncbi:hypothetical protein SAMN04487968_11720 [Nocardioides terrae]|uniref:Uncharacterized protein n=1 Tax=Nocardioides terrae TaxID=574651 RepID=A0A1I1NGZ1_9ACTN|nr:hypothetical protein [Nocardioides terrae]SFC96891.1 hypothetical protein SAMN04487968_11720 [Nocardioides terrae]
MPAARCRRLNDGGGCDGLSGTNAGGYITGEGQATAWAPRGREKPVELTGDSLEGTKLHSRVPQ